MSQSIKLSDELYQELKGLADRECRTVPLMIQYMVQNWGVEKNKTENPAYIPKPSCEIMSGSQANKRLVATGNEHMPVRESLPDELEEAVQMAMTAKKNMMPENAKMVCDKRCIDEGWSDEQYKYEYDKYISEQQDIYDNATAILKEHNVSIGI